MRGSSRGESGTRETVLGAAMDVVAAVLEGICSDKPRPKKSGRRGVCGEAGNRLSSRVACVVLDVKSGEGCSLAAVAVASEMDRLLDGVATNGSIVAICSRLVQSCLVSSCLVSFRPVSSCARPTLESFLSSAASFFQRLTSLYTSAVMAFGVPTSSCSRSRHVNAGVLDLVCF